VADAGTIGVGTLPGKKAFVSGSALLPRGYLYKAISAKGGGVPSYWSGASLGKLPLQSQADIKLSNTASAPGRNNIISFKGGGVPSYWTGASLGLNKPIGVRSFVAGSTLLPRGYLYKNISFKGVGVPSYWTGASLGRSNVISTKGGGVPSYWTGASLGLNKPIGVRSFVAGSALLTRGYTYKNISFKGGSVPSYWTGASKGVNPIQTQADIKISNTASSPGRANLLGVRSFVAGSVLPTRGYSYKNISFKGGGVPSYWSGASQGRRTIQTQADIKLSNISSATGYTALSGVIARAVGYVPSGPRQARVTPVGTLAATGQYNSITMYLRKTANTAYGVKVDMGYSDTLVTILSNGVPIMNGQYIGQLLGSQKLKSQLSNRTINLSSNDVIKYSYTDDRPAAIDVPDAAGQVGFISNTCLDTFTANNTTLQLWEDFESGLGNYSVGNPASYVVEAAPYGGNRLKITTVGFAYATRVLPAAITPTSFISMRFMMTGSLGANLPPEILFLDTIGTLVGSVYLRSTTDTNRRPNVYLNGFSSTLLGSFALVSDVNYMLTISIAPEISTVTITNMDDSTVWGVGQLPTPSAVSINQIQFHAQQIVTYIDDIKIL
jgi:hypothetical protein